MPTGLALFILGVAGLVASGFLYSDDRPNAKGFASGLALIAMLLVTGVIISLMWEAWSPWKFAIEGR